MKKIILIICILLLSGCSKDHVSDIKEDNNSVEEENIIEDIEEEQYIDNNKVKLGIFLYNGNYRNKERINDTYYADFITGTDIGSFEVFLTDQEVVDGNNFKDTWNKYYNQYENIDNIKIGFNIKFILTDGTSYNGNYFEPDLYKFSDFFYTYLYDDVNQEDGAIYSHLESVSDNTLITSIKIFSSNYIDSVENIILSAFTYDSEDDFDEEGNYRGNSIYVIRIKKK